MKHAKIVIKTSVEDIVLNGTFNEDEEIVRLVAAIAQSMVGCLGVEWEHVREISMKEVLREILASGKHKHVLFVSDPDKGDSFEFGPEDGLNARLREVDYITCGVELLTAGEALDRFDFETLSDSSFKVQFH